MKTLRIIALFLCALPIFSQSAALSPVPRIQFLDPNAKPLAGGFLFTFAAGTTTPQNTYTTSAGNVPSTNPIVLDAGGFANVWLTNGLAYKFVLEDAQGVIQYTQDNITAQGLQDGSSIDLTKVLFNPGWAGTVSIQLQQWLTAQYIDMQNFAGFSTTNTDNSTQFAAAIAIAGIGSVPCLIKVPPGTYLVKSSITINRSCIHLVGAGYGNDSVSPSSGTTIKAGAGFNSTQTGAFFGNNFVVALNAPSDMIGARVEQMTIDGAGLADALYVGHANQQSGYSFITAKNFIHVGGGLYDCGAGSGGAAVTVCGANGEGSSLDGPYTDLQFQPGVNMTGSSIPVEIVNAVSPKEFARWSIITSGGTPPTQAGYISGSNINIHDVHIEGPGTGFEVGGSTSNGCPDVSVCNGMQTLVATNVDMSAASGINSHAMELYGCKDCNLNGISDTASGGFGVLTNFGSTAVSNNQNVSWLSTRWNGSSYQVWSSDPGWNWEFAQGAVTVDHALIVQGGATITGLTAMNGNATVSGTLGVGGTVSAPNLAATATVTAGTNITAGGSVAGNTLSASTTLAVGTDANVVGNEHVGGARSSSAAPNDNFGVLHFSGGTATNIYTMAGTYSDVFCVVSPVIANSLGSISIVKNLVGGHWQINAQAGSGVTADANYNCGLVQ